MLEIGISQRTEYIFLKQKSCIFLKKNFPRPKFPKIQKSKNSNRITKIVEICPIMSNPV